MIEKLILEMCVELIDLVDLFDAVELFDGLQSQRNDLYKPSQLLIMCVVANHASVNCSTLISLGRYQESSCLSYRF